MQLFYRFLQLSWGAPGCGCLTTPSAGSFKMQDKGYLRGSRFILKPAGLLLGVPGCGCLPTLRTSLAPRPPYPSLDTWLARLLAAQSKFSPQMASQKTNLELPLFEVIFAFLHILLFCESVIHAFTFFTGLSCLLTRCKVQPQHIYNIFNQINTCHTNNLNLIFSQVTAVFIEIDHNYGN